MPILLATPTILKHPLHPNDSFLIFASDGLWEHLSNEKAVEIVKSHPRKVSSMHQIIILFLHIQLNVCLICFLWANYYFKYMFTFEGIHNLFIF